MQRLVRGAGLMPRLSLGLTRRQQNDLSSELKIARPSTAQIGRLFSSDTDFKPSEELAKERYDSRANEDIERKRARLLYQSRKRGMLENGVILASFADRHLSKLDAEKLDQYDRLINLPTNDWDIFYWATNTKPTPPEFETPVMAMLREHLKSKVSNEEVDGISDCVLGKSRLDDIILPKKKRYELDIDPSQIDLVNYKSELFDDRIKTYKSSQRIQLMTDWRKRMFEHQLKRTVSSPTSLRSQTRGDQARDEVYTQRVARRSIACENVNPRNLIDTDFEKAMKHHSFMQHLLSSNLTNDPLEYDDEAEAWANMVWVRNYGTDDDKISPSTQRKCPSCHFQLHCCDSSLGGYVPREIFISLAASDTLENDSYLCQRCKFRTTYEAELSYDLSPDSYERFLERLGKNENCIIVVLVDLTDFPGSIWKGLVDLMKSYKKQFLIVGNKLDLLPYDGPKLLERVNYAFRKNLDRLRVSDKNLHIADTMVLSARTGFGVDGLVTRILQRMDEEPRDVYLVGSKNSGKSTLFSALLQSDLSAIRTGDIISRISRYEVPTQKVNMLRFPIERHESWQIETKKRKNERVERDKALRIYALSRLSERRQDSMPHISALVNRLDYDQIEGSTALTDRGERQSTTVLPNFSDDHPLARIEESPPMSATKDKFQNHGFFHETPSSCHPDHLLNILTSDEKIEVFPNETIVPRRYSLRPLQTIFISGLGRVDLLTSQSNILLTVFASKYLPIHVVRTSKADKFYNQFLGTPYLGVPFGDHVRLAAWPELESAETDYHIRSNPHHVGSADIVLSSFAWILVSVSKDQECIVRAYTPGGRGIFLRDPPLLSRASRCSLGKKIRDTPVFENPNYVIETQRISS